MEVLRDYHWNRDFNQWNRRSCNIYVFYLVCLQVSSYIEIHKQLHVSDDKELKGHFNVFQVI